jgi:hypothetical protein
MIYVADKNRVYGEIGAGQEAQRLDLKAETKAERHPTEQREQAERIEANERDEEGNREAGVPETAEDSVRVEGLTLQAETEAEQQTCEHREQAEREAGARDQRIVENMAAVCENITGFTLPCFYPWNRY